MNYMVRPMVLADLPQVMEIEQTSFSEPWSRELFHHEVTVNQIAHYSVVCQRETILGYVGLWLIVGELHITTIAVAHDYRRKGIGELLLASVIELAMEHGAQQISLEVRESNLPAQAMYKKLGFVEMGRRRRYYSETNEDAILMSAEDISSDSFQDAFQQLKQSNIKRRA